MKAYEVLLTDPQVRTIIEALDEASEHARDVAKDHDDPAEVTRADAFDLLRRQMWEVLRHYEPVR